jgi:branched-chain amino acid transport system ATP-binding protein
MLHVDGLTVAYGGVRALDGVSLSVPARSLVGLIGPNGAGKTTFLDAVTGFTPYGGSVRLGDRALDGVAPHRRARVGLVRTFQSVELFDDLDVAGNLRVAAERLRWWRPLTDLVSPRPSSALPGPVAAAVEVLGVGGLLGRAPGALSEGERKLVGLCRALACEPRVLLLDEPAAGLDTAESRMLAVALRAVVDTGVTVLLVDHDMDLVLGTCEAVHVLEFGRLIASGAPDVVRHDERVVAAYLGSTAGVGS